MARSTSNLSVPSLVRYLSLAPVLAVLLTSAAFSLWLIINWYYPNQLTLGQ